MCHLFLKYSFYILECLTLPIESFFDCLYDSITCDRALNSPSSLPPPLSPLLSPSSPPPLPLLSPSSFSPDMSVTAEWQKRYCIIAHDDRKLYFFLDQEVKRERERERGGGESERKIAQVDCTSIRVTFRVIFIHLLVHSPTHSLAPLCYNHYKGRQV